MYSGAYIYIVEVYNENERFVKIGVAENPYVRYQAIKNAGYEIREILLNYFDSKSEAFDKEKNYLHEFSEYKYMPNKKFDGYTECFSHVIIQSINDYRIKKVNNDNYKMRPKNKIDKDIIKAIKDGEKQTDIAKRFGLKDYQVTRIKKKYEQGNN